MIKEERSQKRLLEVSLCYQAYKALAGVGEARYAIDKGKDVAVESFWNNLPGFGP